MKGPRDKANEGPRKQGPRPATTTLEAGLPAMQRISITAVLLLCLASPGFGQNAPPATADTAPATPVEPAQDLAGRGRLEQAMTVLDQLAVQSPEPAGVERLRGIIFYQRE